MNRNNRRVDTIEERISKIMSIEIVQTTKTIIIFRRLEYLRPLGRHKIVKSRYYWHSRRSVDKI